MRQSYEQCAKCQSLIFSSCQGRLEIMTFTDLINLHGPRSSFMKISEMLKNEQFCSQTLLGCHGIHYSVSAAKCIFVSKVVCSNPWLILRIDIFTGNFQHPWRKKYLRGFFPENIQWTKRFKAFSIYKGRCLKVASQYFNNWTKTEYIECSGCYNK